MAKRILVVDSDEAFALMLRDSIRQETGHEADVCGGLDEAAGLLGRQVYDLAIVDLGPEEQDGAAAVRAIRRAHPGLRIAAMPLLGEELPAGLRELDLQGVLTKPFFIGDLRETLEAALAAPVPAPAPPAEARSGPGAASPALNPAETDAAGLMQVMSDLHREIAAELVLLVQPDGTAVHSGQTQGADPGQIGRLLAQLSRAAGASLATVGAAAGEAHQGYCEGAGRRLYWSWFPGDWLLACALRSETPLGMLRYPFRRAAGRLEPLLGRRDPEARPGPGKD